MRFGLQIDTWPTKDGNEWDTMLAATKLAEEVGFESVWYEDHFMFRDDEKPDAPSPRLECLTTLAALAASTSTIKLGMLVLGVPYRNPALVAKMLTTMDVISHGRMIAGLGAGWHRDEFDAYGWPYPEVRQRMDMLEDAVQIIDRMMKESPASFSGKHFSIDRAINDPPPVQRPRPPILVAGNGELRTLRIVAQHADMCNVYGTVEECAQRFEVLRRHCEEVGRPYDQITKTLNYWALLARDDVERAEKSKHFGDSDIATPEETVAHLRRYRAAGTDYIIVKMLDGGNVEPIRVFAETVMPAFAN